MQSEHCGPLSGPHYPSEPGIISLPNLLPQKRVLLPSPVPYLISMPARFKILGSTNFAVSKICSYFCSASFLLYFYFFSNR